MENSLRFSLVQYNIQWHNIVGNIAQLETILNQHDSKTDIILLPEMFATGFTLQPSIIKVEEIQLASNYMINLAKQKKCLVMGSIPWYEGGVYYNRLQISFPSGDMEFYDKRHLFSIGGEDKIYTSGNKQKIVNYKGWRILPLICYDLRFPVWSRNIHDYHVLVYMANWPWVRKTAWSVLLKARAIENQSYTLGINRTGIDGQGIEYRGQSMVISPLGRVISKMNDIQSIQTISLKKQPLLDLRKKFPVLQDRDEFKII